MGILFLNEIKTDPRIKVIHKNNGGLSDARNVGIEMASGNYIVFVEVKYRSNNKYGYAVEAVNYRKKQIIRHVAQFYMATRYKSCDIPCRFDVIGIDGETVTHIKNAF